MGRARGRRCWLATLIGVSFLVTAANAWADAPPLRVFAASSTAAALADAAQLFEAKRGLRVVAVHASSGALARQIARGAPADLFLSANRKWMDWLAKNRLLVASTRIALFGNRLVLAASTGSTLAITLPPPPSRFDLATALGGGRLAIADPDHAPLGAYAREALLALGAWKGVQRRMLRFQNAALARVMVERGEAAAGILYESDVAGNARLRSVAVFSAKSHQPVVYEIAVLGTARPAARAFAKWLAEAPAARALFKSHGFAVK
jgi:molybdate transport system substrate-binding protein